MFDPFEDDWLKPVGPPVDQRPPQLVMARWLMKLKCRRLRMIRFHQREGTWRYLVHGDLKFHRDQLAQMYEDYQRLLELYEVDLSEEKE